MHLPVRAPCKNTVTRLMLTHESSLPEMAGGWGNSLMRKETEFLVLDGM